MPQLRNLKSLQRNGELNTADIMVEVFKTNVHNENQALCITRVLVFQFPSFEINFDLEDCDRILRIEGSFISHAAIIGLLNAMGYEAEVLK